MKCLFAFHVTEEQSHCIKLEFESVTELEYFETKVTNQNCMCE